MKLFPITILLITSFAFCSCKKDWLDAKPNQSLVVPSNLKDLQLVLDNTDLFNDKQPSLLEAATDNYYITDDVFDGLAQSDKNIYTWAPGSDFYANSSSLFEWDRIYTSVFTLNTVLEALNKINSNSSSWKNIKGSALFFRANCFYILSQLYADQYTDASAATSIGVILRTEPDINLKSQRSTVEQTYNRVIEDLLEARSLLDNNSYADKTNPTKASCYALLARVNLQMNNYEAALKYADSALASNNKIIDYNDIQDPGGLFPFAAVPEEVIFFSREVNSPLFPTLSGTSNVDSVLYNSYDSNDLRKTVNYINFGGRLIFKGSYTGLPFVLFCGLSSSEMILIKAECMLRRDKNILQALNYLNAFYIKRFDKQKVFKPYSAVNFQDALKAILTERRKELAFRGVRWSDLRRLNLDPETAVTIKRKIQNKELSLAPKDKRYTYPLPNSEVTQSGVQQNPR
jgi:hypothetical protein